MRAKRRTRREEYPNHVKQEKLVIIPEQAREEMREALAEANGQADYMAVDLLWVGFLKAAMSEEATEEWQRRQALVRRLPVETARQITHLPEVDALLDLDPPLDTILRRREEAPGGVKVWAASVRDNRGRDPVRAAQALLKILGNIRNKRAHGFKSIHGPRDEVVLRCARVLLEAYLRAIIALDN